MSLLLEIVSEEARTEYGEHHAMKPAVNAASILRTENACDKTEIGPFGDSSAICKWIDERWKRCYAMGEFVWALIDVFGPDKISEVLW